MLLSLMHPTLLLRMDQRRERGVISDHIFLLCSSFLCHILDCNFKKTTCSQVSAIMIWQMSANLTSAPRFLTLYLHL